MSDAQETKLDSVESSATADQTAAEILTAVKTVDGASSGLDADLLDGVQGASYLRSDADDTYTGDLTVDGKITLSSADPEIFLTDTTTSVTHSIDGNSGVGNLFMHVDKDETGSDPKLAVNIGSQDSVLVAKSTGIDVTGNVNATASLTFGSGGAYEAGSIYSDANWGMIHRAFTASPVEADHLFVNSAGTERMRIDSGGIDVTGGIEVNNSTAYRGIHLRGNGAPNVTFGRNNVTTAEWKAGISGNLGTSFTISEGTAAASERLVIATGGDVSIPSGNLDVTGTLQVEGATGETIRLHRSDTTVSGGNLIGQIAFSHDDDTNSGDGVLIKGVANGGTGNTTLQIHTGTPGSLTEKIRVSDSKVENKVDLEVTGTTKTNGTGYNPANTQWATNAALITTGSYGGGLTFVDGSAGYSIRVENSGADLVIGQGATSGALTQKVKITSAGIDVNGNVEFNGLSGTGAVTVTDILDEDNMASNSATALATQQSIKAYVDANAGGGSGDITAVVAGTGLSGGATSGSATLNIDAAVVPATATELSSSVDLNDLDGESDAGFYYQTSNADTTGNNYPDNRAGSLIVQKSAAGVTQLYSTFHPSTPELYFRTYYGTGGNTWNSWRKVWTDGNDGAGSGLSADTLDGVSSTQFLRSDTDDEVNAYTTQITFPSNTTGATASGDQSSLQVKQATANSDAFMTFHVAGDFAAYFGIDGTTNDLFVGGWSMGANKYKIWHQNNDGSGSGLDADTVDGKHSSALLISDSNSNANFDTAQQSGIWRLGSTLTNGPSGAGGYGTLLVANNVSDTGFQMYVDFAGNANAYIRGGNSSTFGGSGSNTSWAKLWSDQNDGSGSGLDADTLDGVQGASYLRSDADDTYTGDLTVTGTIALSSHLDMPDAAQIKIGTGDDLLIYQDGAASIVKHNTSGQLFFMGDDIRFVNQANNNAIMYLIGDVVQFYGNSTRPDGTHSYFGTGNDLDMYHDGSNSWIRDIGTGDLFLDTNSGVHLYANGNENMLYAVPNGAVTLYHNNAAKLATTSSGIDVTGTGEFDSMIVQSAGGYGNIEMGGPSGAYIDLKKPFSDDYDFRVMYDGTASLKTTGNYVQVDTASGYVQIGPQNTSYCHFSTDRARFYFNKEISVDTGIIRSHNEDLKLNRGGSTTNQLTIANGSATFGVPLNVTGAIVATGDVTAFSDEKLKENIEVIPNAIEKVSQIRGVTYTRNDLDDKEKVYTGVIAQEVEKVLPEVVNTTEDDTKTVAYGNMVGLLIEAVKEQQEQINELKKQIEEMK